MRAHQIIPEAISFSQHEPQVRQALQQGLLNSFQYIARSEQSNPQVNRIYWGDHQSFAKQIYHVYSDHIHNLVTDQLIGVAYRVLEPELDVAVLIEPTQYNGYDGYAISHTDDGHDIVVSEKLFWMFFKARFQNILNDFRTQQGPSRRVEDFYSFLESASIHDVGYWGRSLINTFIHELVHIQQHQQQYLQGQSRTQYRSYLQKNPDEFRNRKSSSKVSQTREFDLYYSSPQEIAAHAHNIVLKIIHRYQLDSSDPQDIKQFLAKDVAGIVRDQIRDRIGGRFANPARTREYEVFKRYARVVYSELQRYLEKRRDQFTST
jgi:hypothetical protein